MAISTNTDDDVLSEINVTPLVDVMLVLLVAFIVTAPLMTNSIQVNLPKASATKTVEQKKPVTVSVDAEGKLFIDREEYPLENIELELKRIHASNPDVTLHLSSDEAVNYGKVAKVMAAIERAGITRVAVLTQGE
jgi:biopolymer transport protein ExbD